VTPDDLVVVQFRKDVDGPQDVAEQVLIPDRWVGSADVPDYEIDATCIERCKRVEVGDYVFPVCECEVFRNQRDENRLVRLLQRRLGVLKAQCVPAAANVW